ncbi:MAG TPA: LPS export ABC transporter periplasmic protein LptC [Clostridia bacterium]|nr:LPS export ABC transporter periplasmic protein LptC [Clostridia bacterium]
MKPKHRISPQLICLLAALLLGGGCSLNYSESEMAESLSEELPNSIIRNYRFVDIRSGRSSFRIYAAEARMYHKAHKTELKDLFFQEINAEGKVVTEGEAARATIFTQTDDVEMHGDISFSGAAQEATIISNYLFWNNEERRLEGNPDQTVTIIKADGSRIRGKGFSADAAGQRVEFSEAVEGIYVQNDENTE